MSMQEREKEIYVHRDVLLAQQKAIEDERHRIAIELAERKNKVKSLRIKYESMVQKARNYQLIKIAAKMEKLNIHRPITLSRLLKKGKNYKEKEISLVVKSTRPKRNSKDCKTPILPQPIAILNLHRKQGIKEYLNQSQLKNRLSNSSVTRPARTCSKRRIS